MYKKGILQMPVAFSAQSCYHKKNALTGGKSIGSLTVLYFKITLQAL